MQLTGLLRFLCRLVHVIFGVPGPPPVSLGRFQTCDAARREPDPLQAELKKRGFTAQDGAILQLKSYTAEEPKRKLPLLRVHRAGIQIPYFDLNGKPTGFYRFRYFDASSTGWDALVGHKPLRYGQEKDLLNELYLPPFVSWAELAKDPKIPLLITEGEFKSAYATKLGFPTIGLGGVWCFKSKKHGYALLPQFKEFVWEGRQVYIVFDSDAAINPDIAVAESALARELLSLGAHPYIARIPALDRKTKTGMDDFLLEKRPEAFRKDVLECAEEYVKAAALFQLNEEVVYIKDPPTGIIVRLDNLRDMSVQGFKEHAYATRIIVEKRETAKGDVKLVEKSAAAEWIKWPFRAEAERITYAPDQPRITSKNELNKWPGWGCEPRKGNVKPFLELFDHLTTGLEPSAKVWLRQWFAYPLQYPGMKLFTTVVLWGKQGVGKSLLGYTMGAIYGKNFIEIKDKDLHGSFNSWARNRQFVMGDEITGGSDRKRDIADRLKGMITQPFITINEKYLPEYQIPDVMNFYFTSQHCDAFFLEDDDRRYFIHEVPGEKLSLDFYSRKYGEWLKSAEGPAALFHYLLQVGTHDFSPYASAPLTVAKEQMVEDSRSVLESWVVKLKENPKQTLNSEATLWTSALLLKKYELEGRTGVTTKGLGKNLAKHFPQWGRRHISKRPQPVKKLNDRVWIISTDSNEVAALNKLNEEQIYCVYSGQHKPKFAHHPEDKNI